VVAARTALTGASDYGSVRGMSDPEHPPFDESTPPPPRSRARDFWQLDLPLVVALILCTVFTVVEVQRASEGVWRAWVYMVEWPLIGAFCIWIWYRFKRESGGGFVRQWKQRVARYTAERESDDPQLQAWREYQRQVRHGEKESQ